MKLAAVPVAVAALALTPAAAASSWMTGPAAMHFFKTRGVTFSDGSHGRMLGGFCTGYGAHHGTLANPTFRTFHCTLVGGRYGATRWYDVDVVGTSAGPKIVRVRNVY